MGREISINVEPELTADNYRMIAMAELDYPSAPVYVHSGVGEIFFGGHTFLGVGQLGKMSSLEETSELQTFGFQLTLSGVDNALILSSE